MCGIYKSPQTQGVQPLQLQLHCKIGFHILNNDSAFIVLVEDVNKACKHYCLIQKLKNGTLFVKNMDILDLLLDLHPGRMTVEWSHTLTWWTLGQDWCFLSFSGQVKHFTVTELYLPLKSNQIIVSDSFFLFWQVLMVSLWDNLNHRLTCTGSRFTFSDY